MSRPRFDPRASTLILLALAAGGIWLFLSRGKLADKIRAWIAKQGAAARDAVMHAADDALHSLFPNMPAGTRHTIERTLLGVAAAVLFFAVLDMLPFTFPARAARVIRILRLLAIAGAGGLGYAGVGGLWGPWADGSGGDGGGGGGGGGGDGAAAASAPSGAAGTPTGSVGPFLPGTGAASTLPLPWTVCASHGGIDAVVVGEGDPFTAPALLCRCKDGYSTTQFQFPPSARDGSTIRSQSYDNAITGR